MSLALSVLQTVASLIDDARIRINACNLFRIHAIGVNLKGSSFWPLADAKLTPTDQVPRNIQTMTYIISVYSV